MIPGRLLGCLVGGAASLLGLVFVLSVGAEASAPSSSFRTIDVPGAASTRALGINGAGDIVGAYTDAAGKTHGFLLRKGRFTTIDVPGATATQAWGINSKNQTVGRYTGADGKTHGFLLVRGRFQTIDFPGHPHTLPIKISPLGTIVGCYHDVAGSPFPLMHGFVKTKAGFRSFEEPGSMHNGVSPDGNRIVGLVYNEAGKTRGYMIRRGRYMPLDYPGAAETAAWDISVRPRRSARAQIVFNIVGIYVDAGGKRHGFLLTIGRQRRFASVDAPGAVQTEAYGVNSAGKIVGWFIDEEKRQHGFLLSR